MRLAGGVAPDIVEDPGQPVTGDFGPHVVQAQSHETVPRHRAQHHADQPPARGAKDRRLFHPQMVKEGKRILALLLHGIGGGTVQSLAPRPR